LDSQWTICRGRRPKRARECDVDGCHSRLRLPIEMGEG
jgi:hypothetical protein